MARAQTRIPSPPANTDLVLWAGQSNAEGFFILPRGRFVKAGGGTYLFTHSGQWHTPLFEPSATNDPQFGGTLHPSVWPATRVTGYGAALAFVNEWRRLRPARTIAIVNIALGGTTIAQHQPGTRLFNCGMALASKAAAATTVIGAVFIQGETDAITPTYASHWTPEFGKWLTAVRAKFGNIPVTVVQLGDLPTGGHFPAWELVRSRQATAVVRYPKTLLVRARGLKQQTARYAHYTRDSYDTLGESIARALDILLKKN